MPPGRAAAVGQARLTAGSLEQLVLALAASGAPARATLVLAGEAGAAMTAGGLAAGRQVRVLVAWKHEAERQRAM